MYFNYPCEYLKFDKRLCIKKDLLMMVLEIQEILNKKYIRLYLRKKYNVN